MRRFWFVIPLLAAACVGPTRPPRPAPQPPAPAPPPAPLPPPIAAEVDWPDRPDTPGEWRYARGAGGSSATYGVAGAAPVFVLRCDTQARRIYAQRIGATGTRLTLRATTGAKGYVAEASETAPPRATATLLPTDPQLDAMAFSRGRILIGVDGAPDLILPIWPEFARVVEDCR